MDTLIEYTLQSMVEKRQDLFGDNSTFLSFTSNDGEYDWTGGLNSSALFGLIKYKRNETCISIPVVLKSAPKAARLKEFGVMPFINEILFYTKIILLFESSRRISHLFPIYYDSLMRLHPTTDQAFIVFENLQAGGYRASEKCFLDYDHLKLMLRRLGEFHAYSYQTKQDNSKLFLSLTNSFQENNFCVLKQLIPGMSQIFKRGLHAVNDPRYSSKLVQVDQLIDQIEDLVIETLTGDRENPMSVVCHGDFIGSNVMFKYENGKPVDLKLVDLAAWRLASPVVDLALVLYLNANQGMRNEHWDDLIDEYYSALKGTFPQCKVPSKESLLKEFDKKSMFAYFVASYFLPPLICKDYNVPPQEAFPLDQFNSETPMSKLMKQLEIAGGELATESLADILRDLMDRGFV